MNADHRPEEEEEDVEGDRLSQKSATMEPGGRKHSDGAVKLGMLRKSFRESIRRVGEKSPLSSGGKGSKVKPKADTGAPRDDPEMTRLAAPPSPSLSTGPYIASPLKSIGGLFQKKEENGMEGLSPADSRTLAHSRTASDTAMALGDSLLKKGAGALRRSLRLGSKRDKDKDKTSKQDTLVMVAVTEAVTAEESKDKESEEEEVGEVYTLPEIPHTPLSVMQIHKLIEMEVLEEAHLNLLSLRQEFQQEREQCAGAASPMELAKKEKDLSLLYGTMRDKVKAIVRDSSSRPSRNKELLVHVVRVIQEEERREGDPGGIPGAWMEAWREAVSEGVRAKLGGVHLDEREQNTSWLAVHLGLLGKAIVEDLESVKRDLRGSYPPSFGLFGTYVGCYHQAVGEHLERLQQRAMELKDYYALLDWIINRYQSERILGSPSLQPEMESESTALPLEDRFLEQLKGKYCVRVQEDMRCSLDKMLEIENEEMWKDGHEPETEDNYLCSQIHMDIWTKVKSNVVNARKLDAHLEIKVVCSCLEELKEFPKRFETEFRRCCVSPHIRPSLLDEYRITYINTFAALKGHMEGYRDSCPSQVDHFSQEVNCLVLRLSQALETQYKNDVRPYLRRMMTRKWLTNDDDFQQLYSRTESLSQHCVVLRPPHLQTLVGRLHFYVVREYVSQLMKNNYSCKNHKHEKAADKIREQWAELRELFQDMKSTQEWLYHIGDHLSDIIGQRNKRDIKNQLQPLVEDYPDISKKHLAAVLYFRGLVRGRERQLILQRLTELKRTPGNRGDQTRALFGDMQVTVNTDCLADFPSCLSFLLPDN